MGFLSGAFSSESSTRTTTTSQNAGQSEVGGSAISLNLTGGGKRSQVNPVINITDQGAVRAGLEAQANAVVSANDAAALALDFGKDALNFGSDAMNTARYGLDNALSFANTASERATDAGLDAIRSALDYAQGAYADSVHVTRDALDSLVGAQQSALGSVTSLARQTSASESDRISKLATYALIAVAALVIIPKVFGK